jgi:hypothetical protein
MNREFLDSGGGRDSMQVRRDITYLSLDASLCLGCSHKLSSLFDLSNARRVRILPETLNDADGYDIGGFPFTVALMPKAQMEERSMNPLPFFRRLQNRSVIQLNKGQNQTFFHKSQIWKLLTDCETHENC